MKMNIPKTPKGISNQITRIRSQFTAFKKEYGFIDDGSGSRYYLFYLYLLLDDNRRSSEYISWYEKQFSDDSGEPTALLCWAFILNRMGKNGDYILARTMLSNIYLLPKLINEDLESENVTHLSNYEDEDYIEDIPERILENITEDDLSWIKDRYNSELFQNVLKRHIEINKKLEHTPVGETRSKLVKELFSLLESWK